MMYSSRVLDHFNNPRNVGEINKPTALASVSNPVCGDILKLWIFAREGKVLDAKFKVQGCVPAVACGSWLTEVIKGKTVPELAAITSEQIEAGLGGLPEASRHAATLAIAALREGLEKLSL
ncbi:MAG TPA: iron-sulfur cluster assembly scaffold protein [Terriglobia bacterium]|nr:iron-sulfur cluster assembly scaffold protein [Terriglobia bacterium]